MKILLLFCAVSLAFAAVPPECSDPTFACQDLESARLCDVVKDCIDDVWSKMTVPEPADNDEVCDICKEMVKEARDQLLSNMTQEEIKEVFEGSCKLLPIKLVADACIKVVDEIIPQLIEMLASRMDPTMVCTVSGMCFPSGRAPIVTVNDDLECEFCEHLIEHVKDLITTNTTMEEFKGALLNFCNHTKFSERCTDLVNEYYDMIFNFIKNINSKGMCTLIGLCTNTQPLVKLIPALEARHRIPLIKLLPSTPIETNDIRPIAPLVELIPSELVPKKAFHKGPYNGFVAAPDNNVICDLCKEALTELQKQLSDPATKQQLKQLAEQGCQYLPESLRDDCISFIDKNVDAFIDILEQELKPDNVCPALGLCPAGAWTSSPRVRDLECDVCKEVVADFREKLKEPESKTILITMLEEGCSALPKSLASDCKVFVDENIDYILNMIINNTDPQFVCNLLSICPTNKITVEVKDVECDICKEVVTQVEDMVKDKKTEDEIVKALNTVCGYLPKSIEKKCEDFVNTYVDFLIEMIVQELDPETICEELNVCPPSAKAKPQISIVREKPQKSMIKDMQCDLCKDVIGQIEGLLKDKKTVAEIDAALDEFCSVLPSSIAAKCKSFVNEYTQTIITLLTAELDPTTICGMLGVCPTSLKAKLQMTTVKAKPQKSKFKDMQCDLCKDVIGQIEGLLKDKKTVDEIDAALDEFCSILPSSISAKCKTFVDEYTQTIITLLTAELDPTTICGMLKVCPTKDIECQSCQYALHFIQEQLMNNDTQDKVKEVLKRICGFLPSQELKDNCDAFVDEYGSSLLVLVAQQFDPSSMCSRLGMCPNTKSLLHKKTVEFAKSAPNVCNICQAVVKSMDTLLEEDSVDNDLTKLVEKVCTVLPTGAGSQCRSILEAYGPYILQMIGQLADPTQLCQEIDLCSRPTTHAHLIGGSKCTFGPSYWCTSPVHASACKAEKFCKENVW